MAQGRTPVPTDFVGSAAPEGLLTHLSGTGLTLLHGLPSKPGVYDEVTVYAANLDNVDRTVNIFFGNDSDPQSKIPVLCKVGEGMLARTPPLPIERGKTIKAQCGTAAVINCAIKVTPLLSH